MPFQTKKDIRFFQFTNFGQGVIHAVFTRKGGVSPDPWAALNLGSSVGDEQARVNENHRLALASLEMETVSLYDVFQVHGVEVAIADSPRLQQFPHQQADAILTDKPGVTLMMRFADCVPILLHDPVKRVVGIVHAGWMGTVYGITHLAVKEMQLRFGSKPADIQAAIGPSICPDHFEVGQDVVRQVQKRFGNGASSLLSHDQQRVKFDLWAANSLLLKQSGVYQVEVAGLCTMCASEDWYSHRAEKGRTGRFGVIIALV